MLFRSPPPTAPGFGGSYPNYNCPCSDIVLAGGTWVDGTYSLIENPGKSVNNGKPVFQQAISGKYMYSWHQYWAVGDDYEIGNFGLMTASNVDCPTDIADWSVTCALPTLMGYPNYNCPCSEVSLSGTSYSLIQNPEHGDNRGKTVYQASSGKYLYSLWNSLWSPMLDV